MTILKYFALRPPTLLEKGEASISYMRDNEVHDERKGTGLRTVYANVTLTGSKHKERKIASHDFIHEQGNDSYFGQVSSTAGVPGSTFNYERNRFLPHVARIDDAAQKVVPTHL